MNEHDLDQVFAGARAQPVALGDEFFARLLDDAQRLQPKVSIAQPIRTEQKTPFWQRIFGQSFWQNMGGSAVPVCLGLAAVTGLFLGYADPADYMSYYVYSGQSGLEMIPAAEPFLFEG